MGTLWWRPHSLLASSLLFSLVSMVTCHADDVTKSPSTEKPAAVTGVLNFTMPGVTPHMEDQYVCTSMKMPKVETYITQFTAIQDGDHAHHMLLYGCDEPGQKGKEHWNCMSPCRGSESIMFAWAKNARSTKLPPNIGSPIGGPDSKNKYLVLQIHYKDALPASIKDRTGLSMETTTKRPKYLSGILIMMSNWAKIPANTPAYHVNVSCKFYGKTPIYPFAFRVHAHELSDVISAYQFNGSYHLIGKGNPLWPQAFYPMKDKIVLKKDDYIAAQCTYNSTNRNRPTYMGSKHTDEMCNFYMMYYTDPKLGKTYHQCSGNNIPELTENLPAGASVPLPPNPMLEDVALGNVEGNRDNMQSNYGNTQGYNGYMQGYRGYKQGYRGPQYLSRSGAYPDSSYSKRVGNHGNRYRSAMAPARTRNRDYRQDDNGGYEPGYYDNRFAYDPDLYQYEYNANSKKDTSDDRGVEEDQEKFYKEVTNQRSRNRGRHDDDDPDDDNRGDDFGTNRRKPINHGATNNDRDGPSSEAKAEIKEVPLIPSTHKPAPHTVDATAAAAPPVAKSGTSAPLCIQEVSNWPSDKLKLGQVAGVTTDAKGNVHIFQRGSRKWTSSSFDGHNVFTESTPIKEDVLMTLDVNAKVTDQWGANMFYMPHGIHIDIHNNLWTTDVALHQVIRFMAGKHIPDLTLGEKFVPGSDYKHFCKPTSVATLATGEFYVADGYCNSRIIKFSADGKYLEEWGQRSSNVLSSGFPPPGTFSLPHSVSLLEEENLICVADRLNNRIQCFDLKGKFLTQMHSEMSKPIFAVSLSPVNGLLYAVSGQNGYGNEKNLHGYVFNPKTAILIEKWAPKSTPFKQPHDIAVSPHTDFIYVAEIGPNRLWKFSVKNSTVGKNVSETVHPNSVDPEDDQHAQAALEKEGDTDFGASLIIGSLLVIPVIIIVIVTVCLRLKKRGKLHFLFGNRPHNRRLDLGTLLSRGRHNFSPLSTDDKDPELDHLQSDSEVEEYSISTNHKA